MAVPRGLRRGRVSRASGWFPMPHAVKLGSTRDEAEDGGARLGTGPPAALPSTASQSVIQAPVYFLLAATLLRSTPILEISISTRSLGFMNSPVVAPTPEMVPVLMRSPGSRVMMAEMYSMIMETG